MKKYRKIIYACLISALIVMFSGLILAIFSHDNATSAVFDIIVLLVSTSSILLALISQLTAERDRRLRDRMIRNIYDIDKSLSLDAAADRSIRYRLDKIIAQNELIYYQMGGKVEDFRSKSSSAAREKQQKRLTKVKEQSKKH